MKPGTTSELMAERNLNCKRCTSEFKHKSTRKKYCPLCEVLQKREKVSRFRNKKRKLTDIDTDRDPGSTKNFLKNENNIQRLKRVSRFLTGSPLCTLMETMKEMYSNIRRAKLVRMTRSG
jgi:hypothetical protein